MKTLGSAIASHILGETTTLATCWKVTRTDGVIKGFTNHDRNITIDGVTYKAATGFNASAIAQETGMAARNLELNSVLSDDGISDADLVGGKYDYARVDIFLVNWASPPSSLSLSPPEHILMLRGRLGQVSISDLRYTAEVRSFSDMLQQRIGTVTTAGCRAVFGDSACQKNLASLTDNVIVTAVTSDRQFTINSGRASGFYDLGQITFTSGANAGNKAMVLSYVSGVIRLFEPMPFDVAVGDGLQAIAGCAKTTDACISYGNILNYQGEPHIPGEDKFFAGFEG